MSVREKIGQVFLANFRYCKADESDQNFSYITEFEDFDGTIIKVVPIDQINQTIKTTIQKLFLQGLSKEEILEMKKLFNKITTSELFNFF